MDPFEALGLERRWDLDEGRIREAQRRASARWHPDRCPDPARREEAQRRMAQVNEAATRLLDPLERGRALLEAAAPATWPPEPRPSPDFLAEMLSLHEGLNSQDVTTRAEARGRLADLRLAAEADVASRFAGLATGDVASWTAAAGALAALRATVRALEGWSA